MNKTPQEIVSDADDQIREIWRSVDDPETLSQAILRLSVLNAGIGNFLHEAMLEESAAERHYKFMLDKQKLALVDEGKSATVAESMAKIAYNDTLKNWHEKTHAVNILKLKRNDVDRIIDAARSRLSLIKLDIRHE